MISITKHIRTAITTLLSDSNSGFNPTLQTVCEEYGISPFAIDFGVRSKNFYQGWYGYDELVQTSNFKLPVMCLYSVKTQNQNLEKFRVFSGASMIGIDLYLSWNKSSAVLDTETLGDAVTDTLYNMFNREDNFSFFGDVIYNGDLSINKGPLALSGDNWLQLSQSRLSVDYHA
jgi:hypothetical protein